MIASRARGSVPAARGDECAAAELVVPGTVRAPLRRAGVLAGQRLHCMFPPDFGASFVMHRREFASRRRRLMDMMEEGSVAIVPTAPVRPRNRDVDFPYRPDSNFYYLTGFGEPEAVAVFAPGREQGEFVMFCRERDPKAEQWHGVPARTRRGVRASRGRRCVSHRRHRRHPAGAARRQVARVLRDGTLPRVRPAHARVGRARSAAVRAGAAVWANS